MSGLGKSPGEGNSYPFQYSGLENSMDCTVHVVTKVGHDRATFTSQGERKLMKREEFLSNETIRINT